MTSFLSSLLFFFALLGLTLVVGMVSLWFRARKRTRIAAVLRRYHEDSDLQGLIQFVSGPRSNYLDLLEYLENAEAFELAQQVLEYHPLQEDAGRHLRVVAARILVKQNVFPQALALIEPLVDAFPNDASILEQAIHLALLAEQPEKAQQWLGPFQRLAHKGHRVQFFQALLLAFQGKRDQAIIHLEKIRDAECTLANNTLAPLTKRQIQEQVKQTEYWIERLGETNAN
ncbi:MAG: hypothetical protein H6510_03640 [Acidobacteria bacterium]|nr:hypothetical protein [Acidobacteriota bacterium]MCB9396890.1 hypothetical protein [Acidobacteriota bacterium]